MMLGLALLALAAQPPDGDELMRVVDAFFAREMEEHGIPGAAFALVVDGEIAAVRGFGFADLERQVRVDPERTVFRVGSNSKTVTAVAALQLVERGVLGLHADANEVLDGIEVPATFAEPVTLFHLLTHTGGFDEFLFGQHARQPEACLSLREYLAESLPRRFGPPGQVIAYNDHGTSLAGLLVEQAGGRPFARYAREQIFAPLGMQHTTFEQIELPAEVRDHLSKAYQGSDGSYRALARDYIQTVPAAGLYTSAGDMARVLRVLLGGGAADGVRILGEDSVRSMLSVQFRHGDHMRGRAFGFTETDARGRLGLKKGGQASGFNAQLYVLPDEGVGWFSVINLSILSSFGFLPVSGIHDRLADEILAAFPRVERALDATLEASPKPANVEADISRFAGTYREVSAPRDTWDTALLAGEVGVEVIGDGRLRFLGNGFVQVEPLAFQYEEGGPHFVRFFEDEAGEVRWVTWHAGAWERVPWYRTQGFLAGAAGPVSAVLVSVLLVAAILAWRRRGGPRRSCPGARPTVLAAALLLVFAGGFGLALLATDVQVLFSGPSAPMLVLFALPPFALIAAAIAAGRLIWAQQRKLGPLLERGYYSVVLIGCGVTLFLLHQWNLFGWRL